MPAKKKGKKKGKGGKKKKKDGKIILCNIPIITCKQSKCVQHLYIECNCRS